MYNPYSPQFNLYGHYQQSTASRNHNKRDNSLNHQENVHSQNNSNPTSPQGNFQDKNSLVPPPSEFLVYPNNQLQQMPYHSQSESDFERYLKHISHQLAYLIQQNHQLLQHLQNQKLPEQSQTVSTPSGGTVIVRM